MIESNTSVLSVRAVLEEVFEPELCLGVIDLISCRHRYRDKFWSAEQMILSREAAEQATPSSIASWRAQNLASLDAGGTLIELGCGLGGDTVYLSKKFQVTSYESDPARALMAQENIARLGVARTAKVVSQEVTVGELQGDLLFVDPARRKGARIHDPDRWSPPLSEVLACYNNKRFSRVAIKCAPGLKDSSLESIGSNYTLTFIAIGDELKEAFLLLHPEGSGQRVAVILGTHDDDPITLTGDGGSIPIGEPVVGGYLHNPNPAVLRARALDTLAEQLDASIVHPQIGYLVGPQPAPGSVASSFEILGHLPLDWKKLKRELAALPWSEYEYLGRGVPFSQVQVRNRLGKLKPQRRPCRGSVIIYRTDDGYRVVLGRRHQTEG